ncbi:cytochrome c oxidase assembly factor 6 homolog, partial [Leptonychotes weddellii]|uniref:Cytochrome c oxidase assembly factor 6 homolog n=1 Tax=Leptonychotes weddellii TaxID=9713 RepID=A0A7F8QB94_LEPWE
DEYWKCLDENTEDASQCKKLRSSFESSCPQQWIKYFDKRRDYLKFKEKFEAGQFQPSKTTAKILKKAKLVQKTDQWLGMGKGVNYEGVMPRNF